MGRFLSADEPAFLGANGNFVSYNLFAYCENDPINRLDDGGNISIPNWAKVVIGVAAIAVGVIATGGAATPVLVASLTIAFSSAAIGAISGAGFGAVSHRVSTGGWEGAGKAAAIGALNGACDGFMWGGITAGAAFSTLAIKGIKVQEIGRLKPANKTGDGYFGIKYKSLKANGKNTTKSLELHSPHPGGKHNFWHWQQNTWSTFNGISRISGSSKYWTIWGRKI